MKKILLSAVILIVIVGLILGVFTNWFGLKGKGGVRRGYCAVCNMPIIIDKNTPSYKYKGKIYYFMSEDHKKTFIANPEQFIKK